MGGGNSSFSEKYVYLCDNFTSLVNGDYSDIVKFEGETTVGLLLLLIYNV